MTTIATTSLGTDLDHRRFADVRDLLPNPENPSPLVRLNRLLPDSGATTFLKLEWLNPFGSVKDRTALLLLEGLAERGQPGSKGLVEASSGNTGIALAALAALQGTSITVTIPDGVPEEKKLILRLLGAQVWETPDDLCPVDLPGDGAIALARSLAASDDGGAYVWPDQYTNPDNVAAHYRTTGPEIWNQTEGRITHFVTGLGTGGTVTGVGKYLKEQNPHVRVVAVEPQAGHRLPGLKSLQESKQPEILDFGVVDEVITVDDPTAYETTLRLWREESLTVGPSTGAVVAAIHRLDTDPADLVVGISADSGFKYVSYFKEILGDEGLPIP